MPRLRPRGTSGRDVVRLVVGPLGPRTRQSNDQQFWCTQRTAWEACATACSSRFAQEGVLGGPSAGQRRASLTWARQHSARRPYGAVAPGCGDELRPPVRGQGMTGDRQRQTRTPCGGWGLDGIGPGVKPGQARAACRARRSGKEAQRLADHGKPGLWLPWRSSDLAEIMQHRLRLLERTWWRENGELRRRNNGTLKVSRFETGSSVGTQSI